jgi:fructoselysine 6-kinase
LRIATVGDNCIDVYRTLAQSAVGGNALNVAVQLHRLGASSEYLGAVGDDSNGLRIVRALQTQGIGVDGVRIAIGSTAVTELGLDSDGERAVLSEQFGVCADYTPSEAELDQLTGFDHVHCANLPQFERVAVALQDRGLRISYDFAVTIGSPYFSGLDVAFLGSDQTPEHRHSKALASEAVAAGARMALVTCGRYGSLAFDGEAMISAPALPVSAVDTCGAGDAYIAAFIKAMREGKSLAACMRMGAETAAQSCLHHGAWPQALERLPWVSA